MRKIFKKEVMIAFIIGIILASSIAVYAYSYVASEVKYTKPGTTTEISVETALNDLYNNMSSLNNYKSIYSNMSTENNAQFSYTLEKNYKMVFIVITGMGYADNSSSSISVSNTTKQTNNLLENLRVPFDASKYDSTTSISYIVNPEKDTVITMNMDLRCSANIFAIEN